MTQTRKFRHVGGSIVWGSTFLDDGEIERQLELALRENDTCLRLGDRIGARAARSLFLDITDALKERSDWMRCTDRGLISNTRKAAA